MSADYNPSPAYVATRTLTDWERQILEAVRECRLTQHGRPCTILVSFDGLGAFQVLRAQPVARIQSPISK